LDNLINQTLKRYRLTARLGSGGMGAVYKGLDTSLNRVVAIKIMHPQYAEDRTFRQRFLQEARVAASLDHPGIVKVYDFDEFQGMLFIVMELISGMNLSQWLSNQRAAGSWISVGDAAELVRQVALALQHTHECGVLHRDIKPANIMIKNQPADRLAYRPVITDLGLAKLAEGMQITRDGESLGTPAYMSPEQALGAKIDARSDVYSLGILLYQLTVGQLPFPSRTISEAIRDHTQKTPPPPSSIQAGFPADLEQIILKALEKDPAQRFQSALAFAKALDDYLQDLPDTLTHSTLIQNINSTDLGTIFVRQEQEERGKSVFSDFDRTPAGISGNIIQVHSPRAADRTYPLRQGTTSVGRGHENDIVLEDPAVSRVHAHIEFDGTLCKIIDQNSSNGTFMEQVRLLAGVAEDWTPDKPLRIGSHWLRLKFTQQTLSADLEALDFQPSSVSQGNMIGVALDPPQLSIDPGQSSPLKIELKNLGSIVDHYRISLKGLPPAWVKDLPGTVQLMPGEVKTISMIFQPPRNSQSRAGRHAFTINVVSQSKSTEFVEQKATLTISHFSQFTSQLHPQKLRSGAVAQLSIENQGNLPETFGVSFEDRGDEVAFEVSQNQVSVPDGGHAAVSVRPYPRKRRWFGGDTTYLFNARVSPAAGASQTHSGEMVSRGLIPVWLLPIAFALCALLVGSLILLPPIIFPTPTPTPEPVASSTPEPGVPVLEEWCIYLEGNPPAAFIDCPIQVKAAPGQTLIIRWRVSSAAKIELDPIGDQNLSGQILYEAQNSKTITLRATNLGNVTEKSIEVIVIQPTSIFTSSPTPSSSQTPTTAPSETPTPHNRQPVQLTGFDMIDSQTGWAEWTAPFAPSTNLYRTQDGAQTWQDVTPPSGYPIGSRFFALDGQHAWVVPWGLYAEGGGVVWRTDDGGSSWQSSELVRPGVPGYNALPAFIPEAFYFLDRQHGWLVVAVDYMVSPNVIAILATGDGGQSWYQVANRESMTKNAEGYIYMLCSVSAIAFTDAQTGYMSGASTCAESDRLGGFTIMNTFDGGYTWNHVFPNPTGLPQAVQFAISEGPMDTDGDGIADNFICSAAGVENTPAGTLVQHSCQVDQKNYAYLSLLPKGSTSWIGWVGETASFVSPSEGYSLEQAGGDGKRNLNVTHDGGRTWQTVRSVNWANARLDFLAPGEGFVLAWRYGDQTYDFALVRTEDGGSNWTTVEGVVR
jgi:serine/threonine protein kinase/photosystem II stability/assembly factor-like uncharacterized protein